MRVHFEEDEKARLWLQCPLVTKPTVIILSRHSIDYATGSLGMSCFLTYFLNF